MEVKRFKDAKYTHNGYSIGAKREMPLTQRVMQSLLFGAKRTLVDGGETKHIMRVDLANDSPWWSNDMAFKVKAGNDELLIECGPAWGTYMESQEWREIAATQSTKLQRNTTAKGKGVGRAKARQRESIMNRDQGGIQAMY